MVSDDSCPDDWRRSGRIPECEACGSLAPEGGGASFGDETFGWVCVDCRGDSALIEYGVESVGNTESRTEENVEVVFALTVIGGHFHIEDTTVLSR